ncbi:MAG: STAS domain-containing protein [Chitinivibrionales bacterium]|nr:STAS domain-containing protein [Chitinivibrionales bacterium]
MARMMKGRRISKRVMDLRWEKMLMLHKINKNGYTLITMPEDVQPSDAEEIKSAVPKLVRKCKDIIAVNLECMKRIYSAGIGVIVKLHTEARSLGRQVCVVNMAQPVEAALGSVRVDKIMPLFKTLEQFELEYNLIDFPGGEDCVMCTGRRGKKYISIELAGMFMSADHADELRAFLGTLPRTPATYVIDLKKVDLMDSAVLGVLVDFAARIKKDKGCVVCARANEIMEEFISMLGLGTTFMCFRRLSDARAYVQERHDEAV